MRCIKHTVYMPFKMPRSWNLDDVEDKPLTALTRAAEALACLRYLGKWLEECHPVSLTCEHRRGNICCAGRKAYMYIRPGESQVTLPPRLTNTVPRIQNRNIIRSASFLLHRLPYLIHAYVTNESDVREQGDTGKWELAGLTNDKEFTPRKK